MPRGMKKFQGPVFLSLLLSACSGSIFSEKKPSTPAPTVAQPSRLPPAPLPSGQPPNSGLATPAPIVTIKPAKPRAGEDKSSLPRDNPGRDVVSVDALKFYGLLFLNLKQSSDDELAKLKLTFKILKANTEQVSVVNGKRREKRNVQISVLRDDGSEVTAKTMEVRLTSRDQSDQSPLRFLVASSPLSDSSLIKFDVKKEGETWTGFITIEEKGKATQRCVLKEMPRFKVLVD